MATVSAWSVGLRRGAIPLVLAVVCFALSWPAIEDLDALLKGLGWILLALGAVIVVATARTVGARETQGDAGAGVSPAPRR